MDQLIHKYEDKLIQAGLGESRGPCRPLIGGLDHSLIWNRACPETKVLAPLFSAMAINSLVYLRPAAPYDKIIGFLADQALRNEEPIQPTDCETRTFLHDLPVVSVFSTEHILKELKQRKCVIVADHGPDKAAGPTGPAAPAIVAHGTVSPEQGFVVASSVVFACYVKFFTDYLFLLRAGSAPEKMHRIYDEMLPDLIQPSPEMPDLIKGPLNTEEAVYAAMVQAGRRTVEYGLVDSYFGNISYCRNNVLYISQTGSSLDELPGCIDPVPLDGSSSAGLTASSELTAHLETIARTNANAILHGHPRFSVILSMDCDPAQKQACKFSDRCHTHCPEPRSVNQIPIVPGEVGTGPTGLCHTLPGAFEKASGVIVYGHGLFTLGKNDFREAFAILMDVETQCQRTYIDTVDRLRD
jgi:ribulose-5-phosphate 4-epimerase/fuculose-1-phosphate aldolase